MNECLSGETPFSEYNTGLQIQIAVAERKERPKLAASLPPKVKRLIELCWDQDFNRRPAAWEVTHLLDALMLENDITRLGRTTQLVDTLWSRHRPSADGCPPSSFSSVRVSFSEGSAPNLSRATIPESPNIPWPPPPTRSFKRKDSLVVSDFLQESGEEAEDTEDPFAEDAAHPAANSQRSVDPFAEDVVHPAAKSESNANPFLEADASSHVDVA